MEFGLLDYLVGQAESSRVLWGAGWHHGERCDHERLEVRRFVRILCPAQRVLQFSSPQPSPRRHTGSGPLRYQRVSMPFLCGARGTRGMRPEAIWRAAAG